MQVFIVLLVLLVSTSGILSASAVDRFETLRITHEDNPRVCIMEPEPELQIKFQGYLLQETYDAITDWDNEMTKFTNGGNWLIHMRLFEYEEHHDRHVNDFPECNIFIEYAGINNGDVVGPTALGYTSYDFSKSIHKFSYIKIYTQAEKTLRQLSFCLGCEPGLAEAKFKTNIEYKDLTRADIRKILLHEFGHALGLGHYMQDRDKSNNIPSIMYPSMNAFDDKNKDSKIEFVDKVMLREIYHSDGFGGHYGFTPRYFEIDSLLRDYIL